MPIASLVFLPEVTEAFLKQAASATPPDGAAPPLGSPDGATPPASSTEPPSGEGLEGETPLVASEARPAGGVVLTDVERFGKKGE